MHFAMHVAIKSFIGLSLVVCTDIPSRGTLMIGVYRPNVRFVRDPFAANILIQSWHHRRWMIICSLLSVWTRSNVL
ncbi:hypothetical protein BDV32DRAFT_128489 [Aspergillus pseudonomiae]|nr:hypothetical protein BDV32DRAFT_128489 [Aspergillus pseudonomiae]